MSGRPFLQIPGPTNVPSRVLGAMHRPVLDHRSPEFAALTRDVLPRLLTVFGSTQGRIVMYPASGTGGWEAALVNTLSPRDRVLAISNGYFAEGFIGTARSLGFEVDAIELRWGQSAADVSAQIEAQLVSDRSRNRYRAVLVVHNETSTGVQSEIGAIRRSMDAAQHDALLMVDAVSSLASVPVKFDEWRVDVCIAASQKGLMLPPGLAVLCVSPRAISAGDAGTSPRSFFDWRPILQQNAAGFFPYTPPTLLLCGLQQALTMLLDEGLEQVFHRHRRLANGVRQAVSAWGLHTVCEVPESASDTVTAVVLPPEASSDAVIAAARDSWSLTLGVGLGQLKDRAFRIGHLGDLNELEVLATLAGTEMSLAAAGVRISESAGVRACQAFFEANSPRH